MRNSALPSVSASAVQLPVMASVPAKAVSDRRYSTVFTPLPASLAVTVTVCVSLKNRPKVTVFRKSRKLLVPTVISAAGGVMSATPSTVITRSPLTPLIRRVSPLSSPMPPVGSSPFTSTL